jgi:hypothetical protein
MTQAWVRSGASWHVVGWASLLDGSFLEQPAASTATGEAPYPNKEFPRT